MFLITGGLGKIGTLLRNKIVALEDAKLFDRKIDPAMELSIDNLRAFADFDNIDTIIHLAEPAQPDYKTSVLDRSIFTDNFTSINEVISISGKENKKFIYTSDINKPNGNYSKLRRVTNARVRSQIENNYVLPLPVMLPDPINETVTTDHLFDLLSKFAIFEDGGYLLKRGQAELIYLATEDMIVKAFDDLITNLNQLQPGEQENVNYIAVKASTFVTLIEKHFPGTKISCLHSPELNLVEVDAELLDLYFESLDFSVLHKTV